MGIRIEIEGSDVAAVQKQMQDLLPPQAGMGLDSMTLQELVGFVEKRAAAEGYDLTIAMPTDRKSPAEQRKADARAKLRGELEGSLKETSGDGGGKDRTEPAAETPPETEAAAAEAEAVKPKSRKTKTEKQAETGAKAAANGKGEDPEARKARVIDKLVGLFNGGKKAEVNKILAEHGNGAKTFSVIPADQFGPIDEAVAALG